MQHDHAPADRARTVSEIALGELYFADLIFVVCKSTAKTAKISAMRNNRFGLHELHNVSCSLHMYEYIVLLSQ